MLLVVLSNMTFSCHPGGTDFFPFDRSLCSVEDIPFSQLVQGTTTPILNLHFLTFAFCIVGLEDTHYFMYLVKLARDLTGP